MSILRDDDTAVKGWLADLEAKSAPLPTYGYSYGYTYAAGDGIAPTPADGPLYLNVAVASCLGWLVRNFPVADLHVIREDKTGDGPEIPGHDAVVLLDKPNPVDDFFTFWAAFLLSDVIDGNSFFVKIRNRLGIHSLWWVPPWDVNLVPNDNPETNADRPILGYDVRVGGKFTRYAPEDVIHIKDGKDPYAPLRGLAALKGGIRSTSTIDRAEYYTSTLMRNMGATSVMLSPSEPGMVIDSTNIGSLQEQYVARTTGINNGKPFVSTQGLKVDRLGLSPEELTLDKIREFPVSAICALIGTPAMAVGLPDPGKTYSNFETALKAAWQNGLIPRQARAAEAFAHQCPELFRPNERLKWDYKHVKALQDDWATKIDGLVKAVGGPFMTRNEAREQVHLDPIDGWDKEDTAPPPTPPTLTMIPQDGNGKPAIPPPPKQLPPPAKSDDEDVEVKADDAREMLGAAAESIGLDPSAKLSDGQRRALCHAVTEYAGAELRQAGETLRDTLNAKGGAIDWEEKGIRDAIGKFFGAALRTIRTGALAATLALKGPDPLTPADRQVLAAQVVKQEAYLKGFETAVRDGSQPPDGIPNRAELYGAAGWSVAHDVVRADALANGMTEEANILGASDHCDQCPAETAKGYVPIGELVPIGSRECLVRCRCSYDFR